MILSWSRISLPWLSRSVISLSWPSFCGLRIFFRLFDAMIVSRMISWLYFPDVLSCLFFMVLHIHAYSIHCRMARYRIPLFVLWSNLDHGFLYSTCPGVWSVHLGLASAVFGFSSGSLMIVSRMISWLYFLMSSLAFFLMVLHVSSYSIRCLFVLSAIYRHFVTRVRVGADILDFCGLP